MGRGPGRAAPLQGKGLGWQLRCMPCHSRAVPELLTGGGALPVRLQFQSCSFYCRVWVNGEEVGDHRAGGFVAFHLDVPAAALKPNGENELFVLADNRFNATTAPMHTGGDFWHSGRRTKKKRAG